MEGQLTCQSSVVVCHTRLVAQEAVGRESRACPRACNVDLSAQHSSKKHVHSGAGECTGGLVLCSVACLRGVLAPAWSVLPQQQRSVFANDSKTSLDREISNAKTFVLGNQNGLKEILGRQVICLRITLPYGDVLVTVDVHRPKPSKSRWSATTQKCAQQCA